jgi:flavin-dependent dehydrogenase
MSQRAEELGVELICGVTPKGWDVVGDGRVLIEMGSHNLESRFLVGADGLHSKIRRAIGVERASRGPKRYGIRRHFEVEPWSPFVEVHWAEGAEAYVTPVGAKEVGVAILWSEKRARFDELLGHFPRLNDRLSGASCSGPARGAGPFRQAVSCRVHGPVALVGDAAGYLDALTGEGLSLAFQSAQALVNALAHNNGLANYDRNYIRLSRTYYRMTGLLLMVAQRPRLRRRVIATLARDPSLFGSLLAITAGDKPIRSIGARGLICLIAGLGLAQK